MGLFGLGRRMLGRRMLGLEYSGAAWLQLLPWGYLSLGFCSVDLECLWVRPGREAYASNKYVVAVFSQGAP